MDLKPEELMDAAIWLIYHLDKRFDEAAKDKIIKEISNRLGLDGKTEQDFRLAVLAALKGVNSCYDVGVQESIRKKFLLSDKGRHFHDAMSNVIDEICGKEPKK